MPHSSGLPQDITPALAQGMPARTKGCTELAGAQRCEVNKAEQGHTAEG